MVCQRRNYLCHDTATFHVTMATPLAATEGHPARERRSSWDSADHLWQTAGPDTASLSVSAPSGVRLAGDRARCGSETAAHLCTVRHCPDPPLSPTGTLSMARRCLHLQVDVWPAGSPDAETGLAPGTH